MAEQSSSETPVVEEVKYGIGDSLKTFQQLSSSGGAARKKRLDNHKARIMGALGDAIQEQFSKEEGKEKQNHSDK
ncbi:uncharacterized protein N7518_000040 [Penicillium psychrosexuale]|uniref:uncharacterized protein n=1 Tax=Penicillium psychrosexuale TaxID=1002107 RepID=UPI00254538FB|nr:uncharacterized protein N7518_000040 [Penicillium psychrosexuale]KAJ5803737.1 hypothetical protein N7518_000040 [Penicillium psychrosexuale]